MAKSKTQDVGLAGHRLAILLLTTCTTVIASYLLGPGCGSGPKVSNAGISGEVKAIQNWRVEWLDSVSIACSKPPAGDRDFGEKHRKLVGRCGAFVQEIREKLRKEHGFQFVVNMPIDGVISVRLFPLLPPTVITPHSAQETSMFGNRGDTRGVYGTGMSATGSGVAGVAYGMYSMLFGNKSVTNMVDVSVNTAGGKSLGNVVVGDGVDDRVSASDVVDAVSRLVKTGTTRRTPDR